MKTANLHSVLRRFGPSTALALASIVLFGCASKDVAYSPSAVAANSPAAQMVEPLELYPLANKYVANHPGTDFMVGSGDSMQPLYKDHTVIITERVPIKGLKPGMTVVFVGDNGHSVAHVLVKKTWDGWIVRGVSNLECDRRRVRADNYIAVVVGAFEPTSSPMLALLQEPAVRPNGAVISYNR